MANQVTLTRRQSLIAAISAVLCLRNSLFLQINVHYQKGENDENNVFLNLWLSLILQVSARFIESNITISPNHPRLSILIAAYSQSVSLSLFPSTPSSTKRTISIAQPYASELMARRPATPKQETISRRLASTRYQGDSRPVPVNSCFSPSKTLHLLGLKRSSGVGIEGSIPQKSSIAS